MDSPLNTCSLRNTTASHMLNYNLSYRVPDDSSRSVIVDSGGGQVEVVKLGWAEALKARMQARNRSSE